MCNNEKQSQRSIDKIKSIHNAGNKFKEQRQGSVSENKYTAGCGTDYSYAYGLYGYPLASVYAPVQNFENIYDCETGLSRGTIFSELDLPFICGGMNGGVNRG